LPFGFDQGAIPVTTCDFSAMIASALNSNAYITLLSKLNYMELKNAAKQANQDLILN